MKKLIPLSIILFLNFNFMYSQCSVSISTIPPICFGGCNGTANAFPVGVAPFQYFWSDGQTGQTATGLCAGPYTLSMVDSNNCTTITQFSINQPLQIQLNFNVTNASCQTCCDGTALVNIVNGNGPYTYQWCNGASTQSIQGFCVGCCPIIIADANGCTATDSACIGFNVGIPDINIENEILVFPNPSKDIVHINFMNLMNFATLDVYNSLGKIISSSELYATKSEINISEFDAGMLFFKINTGNHIIRRTIIKH